MKRARIAKLLSRSVKLRLPLTLITAGTGYGKTTALTCFYDSFRRSHTDALSFFISCSCPHSQPYGGESWTIWSVLHQNLCIDGEYLSPSTLQAPRSHRQCIEWVTSTVRTCRGRELYIILDDYQDLEDADFNTLIGYIAHSGPPGIHLIVSSRTFPTTLDHSMADVSDTLFLCAQDFALTEEELGDYLVWRDLSPPRSEVKRLLAESEGWFPAVVDGIEMYLTHGTVLFSHRPYLFLRERELVSFSKRQLNLLSLLSTVELFDAELASILMRQSVTRQELFLLASGHSFISVDVITGMYRMHPMLKRVLSGVYEQELAAMSVPEAERARRELFSAAGAFYLDKGLHLPGYKALIDAQDYEQIMSRLEVLPDAVLLEQYPDFFVRLFSRIPRKTLEHYIYVWLKYIGFMMTNIDAELASRQIQELYAIMGRSSLTDSAQKQIRGELALIESYACFNDIKGMHRLMDRALRLLKGPSLIANPQKVITFGSPHILFLYVREGGTFHKSVSTLRDLFHLYHTLSRGCGTGFDNLLQAEYSLETGDLKTAEEGALYAYHQGDLDRQEEIVAATLFTRGRIAYMRSERERVKAIRKELSRLTERTENPIVRGQIDLSCAYLSALCDREPHIETWISGCEVKNYQVLYQAYGFIAVVYGRYLLTTAQHVRLLAYIPHIMRQCTLFSNQLGILHGILLHSSALYAIGEKEEAKKVLLDALHTGWQDNLISIFAEYGATLTLPVERLVQEQEEDPTDESYSTYLSGVLQVMKRVSSFDRSPREEQIRLTRREREVLRHLCEGLSNQDIADTLSVAEVTVRKHLNALYRKLGVSNRTEAVRTTFLNQLM